MQFLFVDGISLAVDERLEICLMIPKRVLKLGKTSNTPFCWTITNDFKSVLTTPELIKYSFATTENQVLVNMQI